MPASNVRPEWIDAARLAGVGGSDVEIGDKVFFALIGITQSPNWLATQAVEDDDFPSIPLPADASEFEAAAALGLRAADLMDSAIEVDGVTRGVIEPELRSVGVPDSESGNVTIRFGRFAQLGGQWSSEDDGTVLWDTGKGWRGVSKEVWEYQAGGFQALPKYLSYRVGRTMDSRARESVMYLCRRIAALLSLQAEADRLFDIAVASPLESA